MLTNKSTGFVLLPIVLIIFIFFLRRTHEYFTVDEEEDNYILYNNQHLDIRDNFTDLYKFNSFNQPQEEYIIYDEPVEKITSGNKELFLYNPHDAKFNLDTYKDNFNSLKLKPQKYLTFLSNAHEGVKKRAPISKAFRGSCDDKVNESYQKESLKDAYTAIDETGKLKDTFKRDPCVAYANDICEFIDPMLYLSENIYSPPRWLVKTYDTHSLPSHTNISCFNSNYTCCKSSFK